jgi:hypothetical protein
MLPIRQLVTKWALPVGRAAVSVSPAESSLCLFASLGEMRFLG